MTIQDQIEILGILFFHKTGYRPEVLYAPELRRVSKHERKTVEPKFVKSGRLAMDGRGYRLYWDEPKLVVLDPDAEEKAKIRFQAALEELRKSKSNKPKKHMETRHSGSSDGLITLADELEPYSEYDRGDYTKAEYDELKVIPGKKAVLIDGRWIAKSQMKVDTDFNLYVKNWLYEKEFS